MFVRTEWATHCNSTKWHTLLCLCGSACPLNNWLGTSKIPQYAGMQKKSSSYFTRADLQQQQQQFYLFIGRVDLCGNKVFFPLNRSFRLKACVFQNFNSKTFVEILLLLKQCKAFMCAYMRKIKIKTHPPTQIHTHTNSISFLWSQSVMCLGNNLRTYIWFLFSHSHSISVHALFCLTYPFVN